jgi:hypothetical protein
MPPHGLHAFAAVVFANDKKRLSLLHNNPNNEKKYHQHNYRAASTPDRLCTKQN